VLNSGVLGRKRKESEDPWYPTSREKRARCGPPEVFGKY
jgi:hypothetical protein